MKNKLKIRHYLITVFGISGLLNQFSGQTGSGLWSSATIDAVVWWSHLAGSLALLAATVCYLAGKERLSNGFALTGLGISEIHALFCFIMLLVNHISFSTAFVAYIVVSANLIVTIPFLYLFARKE